MSVHTTFGLDPALIKARKPKRLPAALDIQLRIAGGRVVPARLHDFSVRGFGVECSELVLIGSTVELDLPVAGWVSGIARWSIGNRVGGWFLEEVALDLPSPEAGEEPGQARAS